MKWLASVKRNPHKAFCKLCLKDLIAGHSELKKHEQTKIHRNKANAVLVTRSISKMVTSD